MNICVCVETRLLDCFEFYRFDCNSEADAGKIIDSYNHL